MFNAREHVTMSARKVADLLSIAGEGLRQARQTGDSVLLSDSRRLIAMALECTGADDYFNGVTLALSEDQDAVSDPDDLAPWGNDPSMDSNDDSPMTTDDAAIPDEEDDGAVSADDGREASSPGDVGVVPSAETSGIVRTVARGKTTSRLAYLLRGL
jgi:hypothetical protein